MNALGEDPGPSFGGSFAVVVAAGAPEEVTVAAISYLVGEGHSELEKELPMDPAIVAYLP